MPVTFCQGFFNHRNSSTKACLLHYVRDSSIIETILGMPVTLCNWFFCGLKGIRIQVYYICCVMEPEGKDCVAWNGSESRYTVTAVFWSLKEENVWPERDQNPDILVQLCTKAWRKGLFVPKGIRIQVYCYSCVL